MKGFLDSLPDGLGDVLRNARDGEGRALFNRPDFVKLFTGWTRDLDPVSTVVNITGQTGVSVQERIEQIQGVIREKGAEAYKGEAGQKLEKELQQLIAIRDKQKAKAS